MELSIDQIEYLEWVGRFFTSLGATRAVGKLYGLFLITNEELTLDEMARLAGISKASASTSIRMLAIGDLVERTSRPGDRKDYYRMADMAWTKLVEASLNKIKLIHELHQKGQAVAEGSAKTRLEAIDTAYAQLGERLKDALTLSDIELN